jgi:hypothetical protein
MLSFPSGHVPHKGKKPQESIPSVVILFGIIEHLLSSNPGPNKKPNFTCCDHNDVTLGSSAVFQYQVLPGLELVIHLMEANNPTTGSTGTTKTRGFPSPPYDGFGFLQHGI